MMRSAASHTQALIPSLRQQTWHRLALLAVGSLYLWLHAPFLQYYQNALAIIITSYVALQLYYIITIPHQPISTFRLLLTPLLDTLLISTAIFIDGSQESFLFLFYLAMIMGNGFRFGNAMLIYSQALSLFGYLILCIFTYIQTQTPLDITMCSLHILSLLILPSYFYFVIKGADASIQEKEYAESMTFGLLERSPTPIFTFTQDASNPAIIRYANSAMQTIYKGDIVSLIGESVDNLALKEDRAEIIKACQKNLSDNDKEPYSFYIRGRNAQGNILQLMGQTSGLRLHKKIIGVCFLVDITQRNIAHTESQHETQDAYMGVLVAGIVHDFRNVLTTIIGSAEVLQFDAKDKQLSQQLGLIIDAGERGSSMVSNLLSLGKTQNSESNGGDSIYQSLVSMIGLIRVQLPPHIQLIFDMDKKLPSISIGLTEIEQIFMNLIKNATESMSEKGCIHVHLYAEYKHHFADKSIPALAISIRDEGIGIAPENLKKVVQPFWTSRSKGGGTGLGLAMVQHIIKTHKGIFDIQSELGKGTHITILFPASNHPTQNIVHEQQPKELEPSEPIQATMQTWLILLVDDFPEVLDVQKHFLERMGHQVITATSGEQAWEIYQQQSLDMVMTDFRMTGIDGIELCKLIRQKHSDIPLLMVTAYGEHNKLQQSDALGVMLMNKPISYQRLKEKILDIQQSLAIK